MNWEITGGRPVYLQLIEQMERAIVAGEYRAGARLPAVRELAAEAAVNPNTMQRALQELEARGLVNTQRTAGRTVTGDEARIAQLRRQLALREALAFLNAMRALGYDKQQTLSLLEDLRPPFADAPDIFADAPDIGAAGPFAGPSDTAAGPSDTAAENLFAVPSDAAAAAQSSRAGTSEIPVHVPGHSADTPNSLSHKTGRK